MRQLDERTPPPPRRTAKPWWRRPGFTLSVTLTVLAGGATAAAHLWRSGQAEAWWRRAEAQIVALSTHFGFTVQEINVTGRDRTPRDQLLAALQVERGSPILAFDPVAARRRVEALPWVAAAVIERHLPDTVYLGIQERQPLALWQHGGKFSLVDRQGVEIPETDLGRYTQLPLLVGDDAPPHAAALLDLLAAEAEIAARVKAAVRVGARRWNLVMDSGIEVQLPEDQPGAALARLAEAQRNHDILGRDLAVIDLRLPDRMVVRTTREPEEPVKRKETKGV